MLHGAKNDEVVFIFLCAIEATKPIMIAPIHTENADWFKENYPTTKVHTETKEIELQ